MELPKTVSAVISFEIAKLKIEGDHIKIKPNKKVNRLIKLTSKYIKKLLELHYDQAKVYFNDTEFTLTKWEQ